MPSFLDYVEEFGKLPVCLTMSFAAYIAFYSTGIKEREGNGLICVRPAGNEYKVQDDPWVLDFYYEHRNDSDEDLVKAVMTNEKMWGQDLTEIPGFEEAVNKDLALIRKEGAEASYKFCLA